MDHSDPYLHHAPAPQHYLNLHQQQPYPSYYYPDPNPNPNPNLISNHDLPGPSAAAAAGTLQPPVVDPYPPDPYASHGGYDGTHSAPPHLYPVAPAPNLYYYAGAEAIPQQYPVNPFNYGVMQKVGARRPVADLETKKRKVIEGGTPADSVRVCSTCNVVCNSDKVFASHLAGEKHALKALGISSNGKKSKVPPHLKAVNRANKAVKPIHTPVAKMASKGPIAFVQSRYCEVCKIDCNSEESFNMHKVGKKHMKNLQKLQDSMISKQASTPITTVEQKGTPVAAKAKAVSEQDLETKKRKLMKEGAAADAVRECNICSIVCNSETVFNFHIRGQKHLAMVQQQQKIAPVS